MKRFTLILAVCVAAILASGAVFAGEQSWSIQTAAYGPAHAVAIQPVHQQHHHHHGGWYSSYYGGYAPVYVAPEPVYVAPAPAVVYPPACDVPRYPVYGYPRNYLQYRTRGLSIGIGL